MKQAVMGLVLLVVFSLGFLLGRQFPARHYEILAKGEGAILLFETATGRVCDALPPKAAASGNAVDRALAPTVDQAGLPYCERQH